MQILYKGKRLVLHEEDYDIWSVWINNHQLIGWVIQDYDGGWYAQTLDHKSLAHLKGKIEVAAAYLYERMFPCGT